MAFTELKPTYTLFQYTSVDGFYGITRSKNMWLSDLTNSNDPRDIVLGVETLDDIVREVSEDKFKNDEVAVIELIYARARAYITSLNHLYTACFTPNRDDLNMWREYGEKGRGLAIGFRPRAINDMQGRIYAVRYVTNDVVQSLRQTVFEIFSPVKNIGMTAYEDEDARWPLVVGLISLIASIKHDSWRYENEIRLTFANAREKDNEGNFITNFPTEDADIFEDPLVRRGAFGEIEYYSKPFGKLNRGKFDPSGAIEHVVLGHGCSLTEADAEQHMVREGFRGVQVSRSTCLFR